MNLPYWTLMAAVTGVYFLASSMPSFQFLDFAIKVVSPYISCGILGVNRWIMAICIYPNVVLNIVLPIW
jgi:hypothetical protein